MLYSLNGSIDSRNDTFDFYDQYQILLNNDDESQPSLIRSYESYKSYRSKTLLQKQPDNADPALYFTLYRRSNIHLIFYIIFIMVYISIGAISFKSIEEPTVREKIQFMNHKKLEFLQNHTCISDKELTKLIRLVELTSGEGISATANYSAEDSVWGFGQAALFATTVLTTVGYGNTKPLSILGKIFCIIYAIFGIPLVMVLFSALVDRLAIPSRVFFEWLSSKLEKTFGGLYVKLLHCFLLYLLLVIFIFILPTLILTNIEKDWDFFEGLYYCYISLTTIGLGDYVPGETSHGLVKQIYKLCITGYLFIGITCVLLFLRTFHEISELNIGYHFLSPYSDNKRTSTRQQRGGTNGGGDNGRPDPSNTGRDCHSSAADVGNLSHNISNSTDNKVIPKQRNKTIDTSRPLKSIPPRQSYNSVL